MPQGVHLQGLATNDSVTHSKAGDDARVAVLTPGSDSYLAPFDAITAVQDKRKVIINIEHESLLRHHQRLARPHRNPHPRQHLRLQLEARIIDLTADLQGVRVGIHVWADP